MIDTLLHARLQPVLERRRRAALWRHLSLVWSAAAVATWSLAWLIRRGTEMPSSMTGWILLAALAASAACWLRSRLARPDLRRLASQLEARHGELDGRLLTAIQQVPDAKGDYSFLQERLFEDAVRHSVDHDWGAAVPPWRVTAGRAVAGGALAACLAAFFVMGPPPRPVALASTLGGETTADGVTVTPGDATLERGTSFTVMVRFDRTIPAAADLVIGAAASSERRVPLVRSLGDPVFGGTLQAEVTEGFSYRIDYGGKRTRDFKVSVFEHPRLERSDVELTPPAYTGLPPQRIEDTRRASGVEGTRLALSLQLNKPVVSATLVPKTGNAPSLTLTPDPARAVASLTDFALTSSQTYELRLVDADGRTNKLPDLFVFAALPNLAPELKLAAPRGDLRPSALEEIGFEGTAWDDFGVLAYGVGLSRGGQPPELVELGRDVPAKEKAAFQHMLRLEPLGTKPDELFSWFVWADDIGPDGQRRRTQGDLFFAEVRPFDEIFREGAGTEGGEPPPGEQQGAQQGSPATRLAELQKQIINATWKLQRSQPPGENFAKDAVVVRDSQQQAIDQAKAAASEVEEPMRAAFWKAASSEMERALEKLKGAPEAPTLLAEALVAEQSAYQALLKLRERETEVSRRQQPPSSQASAGEQQRQEELEELELEQAENRYETQRQAQPQQNAERRTQMQVQNRLQELAQRQEDVNEKLKELQTALQAAADDQQREELRRQLKRLEEEQRQMLADMDELNQRMDRPEVQSQMAQQRQQLDQTRQDAQRAAEAASQGEVAQALAAGTRAQRQLQEMRDALRKQTASALAEELRDMRAEARTLARQQEELTKNLAAPEPPSRPSLSETPAAEKTLEKLEAQRERTAELVDRATQLSAEAEASEPLVSRQLYDSLRQFSQTDAASIKEAREALIRDGTMTQSLYQHLQEMQEKPKAGQALSLTSDLLRAELEAAAQRAARQAESGLGQLRSGVEKAAEKILGDDTAALQAAEKELEALADEVAREAAAAQDTAQRSAPGPADPSDPSDPTDQSNPANRQAAREAAGPGGPPQDQPPGAESEASSASAAQQASASPGAGQSGRSGDPAAEGEPGQPGGAPPEGDQPSGDQPPAGQSGGRGQQASAGQSPGQQPGQSPGQSPGDQAGQQPGQASGGQPGQQRGQQSSGSQAGGGGGPGEDRESQISRLLGGGGAPSGGRGGTGAPIGGEGFTDWSDRLREVEEMVEFPDLRNAVASARERARVMRLEANRERKKPDWAVVELEILKPLVEVRQQVRDELRRRSADEQLAPIDRDPVPDRFAELVRRYYEELGRDK